jgi:pSer/pThr/pTyr-binding forkhead associated (FHA) protein
MSILPSAAGTGLAQLVIEEPAGDKNFFPLSQFPVIIGRSEDSHISFDDRWLSRQHCEIDCHDGQLIVRDLGSRHGTFVNELRIDECPLNMDDQLRIGLTRFTIRPSVSDSE